MHLRSKRPGKRRIIGWVLCQSSDRPDALIGSQENSSRSLLWSRKANPLETVWYIHQARRVSASVADWRTKAGLSFVFDARRVVRFYPDISVESAPAFQEIGGKHSHGSGA